MWATNNWAKNRSSVKKRCVLLIVDLLNTNHTRREQNIDPCGLTTLPHWLACVDIHKQTASGDEDDDDDDDIRDGVGLENSSLHDL